MICDLFFLKKNKGQYFVMLFLYLYIRLFFRLKAVKYFGYFKDFNYSSIGNKMTNENHHNKNKLSKILLYRLFHQA